MMQPLPKLLMARCIKKSPTLVGLFEFKERCKGCLPCLADLSGLYAAFGL